MTDEQAREIAAGVLRGSAAVGRALSESSADPVVRLAGYAAAGLAEAIAAALRTHPPAELIARLQEIAAEPSTTSAAELEERDAELRAKIRGWYAERSLQPPSHPLDVRRAIPMPPVLDSERPAPFDPNWGAPLPPLVVDFDVLDRLIEEQTGPLPEDEP